MPGRATWLGFNYLAIRVKKLVVILRHRLTGHLRRCVPALVVRQKRAVWSKCVLLDEVITRHNVLCGVRFLRSNSGFFLG